MKKIEEAARKHCGDMDCDYTHRAIFMDAARYVLDQLTSAESARLVDLVRVLRTSTREQLAAVRKEIEGE